MNYKKILTVQDISCVGQCSITVALPVLSACGFETAVLPCSVLSNHTTGFSSFSCMDLSGEMLVILQQWRRQGIKFSALYSGYIGNVRQLKHLETVIQTCLEEGAVTVMDPAMADNGRLYPGFDEDFVNEIKKILPLADYILPNVTEACFITGTPCREHYDRQYITELLEKLVAAGCRNIVITGVSYEKDVTGVAVYENGRYSYYGHQRLAKSSPGTGDVFASVFTAAILRGISLHKSAEIAADFVVECLKETMKYPQHSYGPVFEPLTGHLIAEMNRYTDKQQKENEI